MKIKSEKEIERALGTQLSPEEGEKYVTTILEPSQIAPDYIYRGIGTSFTVYKEDLDENPYVLTRPIKVAILAERYALNGFKAFDENLRCLDKQYAVGEKFFEDIVPVPCERGMHFCTRLIDVFNYYHFGPRTRVCLVEATGDIAAEYYSNQLDIKFCTNRLKVVRELNREEIFDKVYNDLLYIFYRNSVPADIQGLIKQPILEEFKKTKTGFDELARKYAAIKKKFDKEIAITRVPDVG